MTHNELNMILEDDIIPITFEPLKTLISKGITHLTPFDFEAFVLEIFETLGFSGSLTQVSSDGGVDILIKSSAGIIVVQCKKYDDGATIGSRELREFLGATVHFKAVHGYFVTTSSFTSQAKDFSFEHNNITLIDGEFLKKLFALSVILSPSLEEYVFRRAEILYGEVAQLDFEYRTKTAQITYGICTETSETKGSV